jgi:myo-inositol-1(or 4)-monophosphatase
VARTAPSAASLMGIATEAARGAGVILLERWRGPARSLRMKSSDTDMVSEADERAEHAIVSRIQRERPRDAIVAEEGSSASGESGLRWFVDPLDGTTNFLYGLAHWSVAIACADDDGILLGVVYDPLRDELFRAERGNGARVGSHDDRQDSHSRELALKVSEKSDLATALVATGLGYDSEQRRVQGRILAQVVGEVRDIRRFGSASLDLAYVASGRFDAYFESVDKPWDWTAGALLVREAGGRVTELHPGNAAFPRIIASGLGIHDSLVSLLARATRGL